jgi:hypothetical protein
MQKWCRRGVIRKGKRGNSFHRKNVALWKYSCVAAAVLPGGGVKSLA